MITAITAITINIPTPIPALKIPPITSQLVSENRTISIRDNFSTLFCMTLSFKFVLAYVGFKFPTM